MNRKSVLIAIFFMLAFSTAIAEEIKLTTIMPAQDILRVKDGAIGTTYKNKTDAQVPDNVLYVEGGIAIGDAAVSGTNIWPGHVTIAFSYPEHVTYGSLGIGGANIHDFGNKYLGITHNLQAINPTAIKYITDGAGAFFQMGNGWSDPDGMFRFVVAPIGVGGTSASTGMFEVMCLQKKTISLTTANGTGNIYLNGKAWLPGNVAVTSDIRLKKDITVIPDALERLNSVRGVNFRWKDRDDASLHAGVIAQEVEKVFPELVSTDKDGMKSVSYGEFVGVLIEAVKDLKKDNDELRARIALLEKKN